MKKRKQDFRPLIKEAMMFVLGGVVGVFLLGSAWLWIAKDTVFPGVIMAGVDIGGMQREQALQVIEERVSQFKLTQKYGEMSFEVPKEMFDFDPEKSIEEAMAIGKTWSYEAFRQSLRGKIVLPITSSLKTEGWQVWESEINGYVTIPSLPARFSFVSGKINIINGEDGVELDSETLKREVVEAVRNLESGEKNLPINDVRMRLNLEEISKAEAIAGGLEGATAELMIEDKQIILKTPELLSFVSLNPLELGLVDAESVVNYVEGLAVRYNRVPQNARFVFADGRVKEFAPSLDGLNIKINETSEKLHDEIERLIGGEKKIQVEVLLEKTSPKITTGEVNNMGIVELIGQGESYYAHSIANRIYNVGLAASRINGVLVPPGEEFSFNEEVGEITGATGYKTAYVISNGRTELGDGGGVCQVSTTLFRAVMAAGLPISERYAHAYRVGYYEQNSEPGLDATVYSPSKDFKFRNDTPGHILIQTINDPVNLHLIFELYGTKDGRVATTTKSRVSGVTPPPPDLYQDDPSMPVGVVKQVDWAAWGAKVVFDYKVERGGEIVFAKSYLSNYRPWQNVYLRGTGQ